MQILQHLQQKVFAATLENYREVKDYDSNSHSKTFHGLDKKKPNFLQPHFVIQYKVKTCILYLTVQLGSTPHFKKSTPLSPLHLNC